MGVQWGIPQGSAISSIVAEMLLARAIALLPDMGVAVAYADNILLLARSSGEMVSMKKALLRALEAHPAGPLQPNPPMCYGPGDSVEFLGHQITFDGRKVRVVPTPKNLASFERKFRRKVSRLNEHPHPGGLSELRQFVVSWCAAFKLWDEVEQHRRKFLEVVGDLKKSMCHGDV
jgi:hypothetical protein